MCHARTPYCRLTAGGGASLWQDPGPVMPLSHVDIEMIEALFSLTCWRTARDVVSVRSSSPSFHVSRVSQLSNLSYRGSSDGTRTTDLTIRDRSTNHCATLAPYSTTSWTEHDILKKKRYISNGYEMTLEETVKFETRSVTFVIFLYIIIIYHTL